MKETKIATAGMIDMLKRVGDNNWRQAQAAREEFAKALTMPVREGILKGDIVTDIYEKVTIQPGMSTEFPLDFLTPGTEGNHSAFTVPAMGRIPERHVEGDYLMVYTYEVANTIDFALKYAREARWDIVNRALQVLEAGFVRKINTDGWRTILAAGQGRNLLAYDDAATAGLFTKRLVELMKLMMRRNLSGNSSSVNRGKLSRLYISPEGMSDIRAWDIDDVDDITRREIFLAEEDGLSKIFGVELRDIDELGVGQEYDTYFTSRLGGTFTNSKVELVVGLDMRADNNAFVMPVKQEVELYEDPSFFRQGRMSMWGRGEWGFACLDSRKVLLGQF